MGDIDDGPSRRTRRSKSVRVGRTPVGKGIFAQRRYPACTIIGEICGEVIEDPEYGSDYCFNLGDGRQLEPQPPFRFVNHSCEPNCEFDWCDDPPSGIARPDRHVFLIALREIKPGEELTIDYNWSAASAIRCRCHAPNCRGWIVSADELPEVAAEDPCRPRPQEREFDALERTGCKCDETSVGESLLG